MGRGKLKMELVTNEKKRNMVFKNKKASLIKQIHELTVLCDVKAYLIVYYGTKQGSHIWPENLYEVRGIIDTYKTKESGCNKTYGLSEWFKDKKRKVEQDLANNLRKQNLEAKYLLDDDLCYADRGGSFLVLVIGKSTTVNVSTNF